MTNCKFYHVKSTFHINQKQNVFSKLFMPPVPANRTPQGRFGDQQSGGV